MRLEGDDLLWITMTAHKTRHTVGVSAAGLTFTCSGQTTVECSYDHSRVPTGGVHPVHLKAHDSGSATLTAHHQGVPVGNLRVTVCPRLKVHLTAKNAVSEVRPKDRGVHAKHASGLAPHLREVFASQGGFEFVVHRGADLPLSQEHQIQRWQDRPDILHFNALMDHLPDFKTVTNVIDPSADFTLLFCWGLYPPRCALGMSVGRLILIDELIFQDTYRPAFMAYIVAHEIVHSMGHTQERFGRSHMDHKSDNLMYPSADGGLKLDPGQVELIINPANWYRS
jgi:hypothetical protein